ncbi:MAG: heme exporter protein CcmD [Candidatus Thiosymbion ectosymbiont of Robbea hypermnestra]|nr:heme exporter protein CcmD [Candidatus Thiosymbion ectosymbiont of Robbea hypermnestra]
MEMFFAQGGYAFYVWSSYGMALLLLVWELVQLFRWRRGILARRARRDRTILARRIRKAGGGDTR